MERMKTMLGVNEPCHGEYKCSACNRTWESCRAWKNFGQECKGCANSIMPSKLEQLFPYCCVSCGSQWKDKMKENSTCKKCGSIAKLFMFRDDRRKYMKANNLRSNTEEDQLQHHEKELCECCRTHPLGDCTLRSPQNVNKGVPALEKVTKKKKAISPKIPSSPGLRTGELSPNSFPSSCGEKRKGFSYATVTKIYEPPNWTLPSSDEDYSSPDSQGKYSDASSRNPDTSFDSGDFYKIDVNTDRTDDQILTSKPLQSWNNQAESPSPKVKPAVLYCDTMVTNEIHQRKSSIHNISPCRESRQYYNNGSNTTPRREVQSGGITDYCSIV